MNLRSWFASAGLLLCCSGSPAATNAALLSRWQFDEAPGSTVAADPVGHRDGVLSPTGASFVSGGVSGNALNLVQAADGFARMPHMEELGASDFSFCVWARMTPGDLNQPSVIVGQDESWYSNGFILWINNWGSAGSPGKATLLLNDPNSMLTGTSDVNDGEWHHLAVTHAVGGDTRLYVDGAPSESVSASPVLVDRGAPLLVGGLYGQVNAGMPGGFFTGLIDDLQLYRGILTDHQIDLLQQNPGQSLPDQEDSVVFVPSAGWFTNSVAVTLFNNLAVGDIRYTRDGGDPTADDPIYTAPLMLTATSRVRARIFFASFPISEVYEAEFTRIYGIDDGVPNSWRERYFGPGYLTDPRVAAFEDPDGDGWNNLAEYWESTHPLVADSKPAIVAGLRAIPQISWNSLPGLTYRVWRKARISDPEWELVVPAIESAGNHSSFIDEGAPATAIYQIELAPR